jgi:hypothetical protein
MKLEHCTMPLDIIEIASWASGAANEDRAGARGNVAWVIDGATDVLEQPLTPGPTDASWFAGQAHREIERMAVDEPSDLQTWPDHLATVVSRTFDLDAKRAPVERHEHPSAAGLVVRSTGTTLQYVSLGDCALLAGTPDNLHLVGISEAAAGDAWVVEELRAYRAHAPATKQSQARAHLWPMLRAARARMNTPDGYGVFSITPPPLHFVVSGTLYLEVGAYGLIASDGLMRLVDVFRCYSVRTLFDAAIARGLTPLLNELRTLEASDPDGLTYPRAKTSDDATGVLFRIVA